MAKLPSQYTIKPDEFPQQPWISRLLGPISRFMDDVVRAFNKNLTITDNIDGEFITVVIDGTFPLNLPWTRASAPKAVWIGGYREVSGSHVALIDPLFVDWEYINGNLRILNIINSTASTNNRFYLTLIAVTR